MRSPITLPVSRTPRFVERPVVAALRKDKSDRPASTVAASRDRGLGHFLTALLQALATPAA